MRYTSSCKNQHYNPGSSTSWNLQTIRVQSRLTIDTCEDIWTVGYENLDFSDRSSIKIYFCSDHIHIYICNGANLYASLTRYGSFSCCGSTIKLLTYTGQHSDFCPGFQSIARLHGKVVLEKPGLHFLLRNICRSVWQPIVILLFEGVSIR